jgi:hypothetical protein
MEYRYENIGGLNCARSNQNIIRKEICSSYYLQGKKLEPCIFSVLLYA